MLTLNRSSAWTCNAVSGDGGIASAAAANLFIEDLEIIRKIFKFLRRNQVQVYKKKTALATEFLDSYPP